MILKDPRIKELAKNIINYSLSLKAEENLLIEIFDGGEELASELIKECYNVNANPFVSFKSLRLMKDLISKSDSNHMKAMASYEAARMKNMHAYVAVRGSLNSAEWSGLLPEKLMFYMKYWSKPVHNDIRIPNTKWCVLRYPSYSMAQSANMGMEEFEDFFFNVCCMDYSRMDKAMDPLKELMEKTDKVRIIGKNTNLSFSIKNLPAIKCSGTVNIPDGEVFTAPVRDSVEGYITYNTPSEFQGFTYENIKLEFSKGKIVNATANNTEKINEIFNTDEGARYIGEFALGVNPYITKPMKDILFDEKIMGSFHFTPGAAYDTCFNGNKSAIHWDLVFIQTPEYGGGEIWFDDMLIRKDGVFISKELEGLNPENLI